ncbi:MAG: hypothetical protein WBW44_11630, partial [Solirubrobacterales bacterium]
MNSSRSSCWPATIATAGTLMLLSGCGGSGDNDSSQEQPTGLAGIQAKVYFMAGEQFNPIEEEIPPGESAPLEVTRLLLAGPSNEAKTDTSADIDTAIPDQVKLRELTID